ncbi:alpha/beta fold hydrolase [Paenibacillus tundrae]|uniref:alpha/beta fold hydrolase n=1 Tax=Paenibacillus tundrae TaxID=528187 RepID=UPI0030D55154
MPLIDMPLEQLYQYQGRNPLPTDFDEYWEQGLHEMKLTNAQVELVPSSFQVPHAECFHLYYTGVRGARIHAKYVRPKHVQRPHPAIISFHGYTGRSSDWSELLSYASLGIAVFAMDCRGQGGLSEDVGNVKGTTHNGHIIRGLDSKPEDLLFRHIFLDAVQLAGLAMNRTEIDPNRIGVIGGSQGGGLALACAALEPRIRRVSSYYPFLSDYQRVWEMDLAKDAYQELRSYFRQFDPQHTRKEAIFTRLGYIDIQHLAPRIEAEVLMAVGLMDTICPPSTQFAAYNKIKAPKSLELYPDFGHEHLPCFQDKTMQFLLKM